MKSVVRLTDRPDMTLDVYCGRKTTMQQQQQQILTEQSDQVYTVCHAICIFKTVCFVEKLICSILRADTILTLGVLIFRILWYYNKKKSMLILVYPILNTRYSVMCKVYTCYCGTSEIEHGLRACTVDNPLAKARGLSLHTGAQTMLYNM